MSSPQTTKSFAVRFGRLLGRRSSSAWGGAEAQAADSNAQGNVEAEFQRDPFAVLRRKWSEVPAGDRRLSTTEFAQLPDDEMLAQWQRIHETATAGPNFSVRGWYHTLYTEMLRGKRLMDVGSGLGVDGITFAKAGAEVTFVDIVETNLAILERLCALLGIANVEFCYLDDLSALERLRRDYDAIWCQGSMINAPFAVMRRQATALLEHLPVGGRWIELAYPKVRWEREGRLPFSQWGERTDGPGTPWVEWYDLPKLLERLAPAGFEVVLALDFHHHDFNWFDLVRIR